MFVGSVCNTVVWLWSISLTFMRSQPTSDCGVHVDVRSKHQRTLSLHRYLPVVKTGTLKPVIMVIIVGRSTDPVHEWFTLGRLVGQY